MSSQYMKYFMACRLYSLKSPRNFSNVKLTFFSKPNCGLCEAAKEVLDDVLTSEEFVNESIPVKNININDIRNKEWWNAYCFDIPVLHIEKKDDKKSLIKIMHFFREDELTEKLKMFKEVNQ